MKVCFHMIAEVRGTYIYIVILDALGNKKEMNVSHHSSNDQ
jgi:hypothetical protein